ncbi:MAG TPA: DUF5615 family PIN-like protein [Longimicrobium sp.]|nr:DUF5615 family PIN-like protein [Longimicrobium sp.]
MKRVLFDEQLPKKLRRHLPGFEVLTVGERGWGGVKNGELLRLAASEFDVFLTGDRNLPHQQNLATLELGIVVLRLGSIRLQHLAPAAAEIAAAMASVQPGQILFVGPR